MSALDDAVKAVAGLFGERLMTPEETHARLTVEAGGEERLEAVLRYAEDYADGAQAALTPRAERLTGWMTGYLIGLREGAAPPAGRADEAFEEARDAAYRLLGEFGVSDEVVVEGFRQVVGPDVYELLVAAAQEYAREAWRAEVNEANGTVPRLSERMLSPGVAIGFVIARGFYGGPS